MAHKEADPIAEVLVSRADLTRALGRLFAESFAIYTAEVIARLSGYDLRTNNRLSLGDVSPSQQVSLESAPAWVKEAYKRSRRKNAAFDVAEDVRPRVARNKLVLALRERGWTQAELARRMKKSPTVISRIFRNPERSRVTTLQKVASALGVDLSDLL